MTSRLVEIEGRRLLLKDLDAAPWGEQGPSKDDLLEYYLEVADRLLPHLVHRPLSLLRLEDGADVTFYRTAPAGLPTWILTRRLRVESAASGSAEYVVGSDRASLAYLINLGVISFHPWSCTVDTLDRPDRMIFDVEPTEVAFREVRNAALLVRDLLARYRIESWVKTSGGRGLHVIVPLARDYSFEQVLSAAETISRAAHAREPKLFTFEIRRARRRGKILIDVLRNRRGATLISPFSVRHDSTLVSMPLEWTDLERPTYPEEFNVSSVRERLRQTTDTLSDRRIGPQSLAALLARSRYRRASALAARSQQVDEPSAQGG